MLKEKDLVKRVVDAELQIKLALFGSHVLEAMEEDSHWSLDLLEVIAFKAHALKLADLHAPGGGGFGRTENVRHWSASVCSQG